MDSKTNSGGQVKYVSLTQEQYDSLEEKDEDTLYFVEDKKENKEDNNNG
jgi:hypothetical protein